MTIRLDRLGEKLKIAKPDTLERAGKRFVRALEPSQHSLRMGARPAWIWDDQKPRLEHPAGRKRRGKGRRNKKEEQE